MKTVSLEALREREHDLLDHEEDMLKGLSPFTPTDNYMRLNYGQMGEDSEDAAMRKEHTRKMLQTRPIPDYQPFG